MKKVGGIMAAISGVLLAVVVILGICLSWSFSIKCSQYLKRASDANTIELASQNLGVAIKYLEANNITNGNTGVILTQPENDIYFWYSNLKGSLAELEKVKPETSLLERSNLLIKLRETLLDQSKEGMTITHPDGISLYPHNKTYCFVSILLCIVFVIGILMAIGCNDY